MSWRPLNTNKAISSKLPVLLISSIFRSDSYTIQLTDLTHIWSESLDKRAILGRSKDENTSIDPRDGNQLRVLMDKIKLGLDGGENSTRKLYFHEDGGNRDLDLDITVALPGGLSPLEWPVHLTLASQSLLTEQLTIPLLEAQHVRMREITSLAAILREKDQVIQKLVDNLESQGIQLGQVFPQAASKTGRKVDRQTAEEKVKGLKQFDIPAWKGAQQKVEPQSLGQLTSQIFGQEQPDYLNITHSSLTLEGQEAWWEDFQGRTIDISAANQSAASGPSKSAKGKSTVTSKAKEEESTQEGDDFQVQATPPHLASSKEKNHPRPPIDDSTDDDDDLDAPSQKSKHPETQPQPKTPTKSPVKEPKKLGLIGGRKESPKPILEDDDATTEGSTPSRVLKNKV